MTLYGTSADPQPVPDFLIAQTFANQPDNFSFARGEWRRVVQMVAPCGLGGSSPATIANVAGVRLTGIHLKVENGANASVVGPAGISPRERERAGGNGT